DSLRHQPFVTSVDVGTNGSSAQALLQVRVTHGQDHRRAISSLVASHGALIVQMRQRQLSLEEAFVRLTADSALPLPLGEGGGEGCPPPGGSVAAKEPSPALRAVSSTPRGRGGSRPAACFRGRGGWRPRLHA